MMPRYTILNRIYSSSNTNVYRAIEEATNRPVIIKQLVDSHPTFEQLWQFRHQYTIARHLQHPQILEIYRLESDRNGYALVMEDFGGISLREWIDLATSSLESKLQIAIDLTLALQELGRNRIIHKDIKPANILINPVTKQVKIIDFGISSLLPKETLEILNPNVLEGTLAYIAPEQTGRMNRGIDYRSDFYSLGVTLFELFTGELPFHAEDAIGWVYCHLAQMATPADRINPDLPVAIAQIIAKLMAKNAEDRYQTAFGIKFDLTECLRQWQVTGSIIELTIGQRDLSDRFSIPERLYGRESAVQTLLDAFARVALGSSESILLAGCSGIGKTAVINEIHKPIARQRGYFIKGKFDQFNRNIPFSAFVQAFRDLIGQLLSESDAQLALWKSQILAAVGENGRVLIEVIPELELIIGFQPPVAELAGTAAQSRFNLVFQRFVATFASVEHPLTIFLDDLQWADAASLQLMKLLVEGKSYLLLLGAYRDNEVSSAHPLMLMLGELQQAKIVVSTITLAPLTFDDANQLVADTLHCSIELAKPLTGSIDLKAHGNPLFITQFLKALHADGEIWFNPDGYWECDISKIQSLAITDDVVEFIAIQIQKLPMATQDVLKLAACIGDRFDLEVLSIVSEQSQLVATAVWNGLYAGLILPTSQIYKFNQDLEDLRNLQDGVDGVSRVFQLPAANSTYCFLHDRVQQAAYSLIPDGERQQTHLQIGRLLLANTPPEQQSERLFEMVNHFNTATSSIQQPDEREMVATLNLLAAQKARAATAYGAAVGYGRMGIQLLGKSAWQQQYELALALHETLAEATFLNGDLEQVSGLVNLVLERAKTPLDLVKTYETMIQCHVIQKQYQAAISQGLEILQQLGIKLAPNPNKLTLVRALLNTKVDLWGKSHAKLVNSPEVIDPEKIAPLRILNHLLIPAFVCSQELMVVLIASGIQITLRYGNTPWAAVFYATYGIVIASLGDFNHSYQMGKLAMELDDRFDNRSTTSQVNLAVAWFCQPWREHLRHSKPPIDECIQGSLESGNLTSLGLSYFICKRPRGKENWQIEENKI
jgi:predicted ATPase